MRAEAEVLAAGDVPDPAQDVLAAYGEGRKPDIYPGKRAWLETIRAAREAGRVMQRVHVVTEPLSAYLRFEIGWSYRVNHVAGEDIRILPRDQAPALVTGAGDYWLLDSSTLVHLSYEHGRLVMPDHVTSPGLIVAACRARDTALHHAIPLDLYVNRREPQLQHAS